MSKKSWFGKSEKHTEDKIRRVFVFMNTPNDEKYANKFMECLKVKFEENNIPFHYYLQQKMDLTNSDDIKKMITDFRATHYITISKHSTFDDGVSNYITFEAILNNTQTGSKVWEGYLNLNLGIIKKANQAQNDAALFVEELKSNKLID